MQRQEANCPNCDNVFSVIGPGGIKPEYCPYCTQAVMYDFVRPVWIPDEDDDELPTVEALDTTGNPLAEVVAALSQRVKATEQHLDLVEALLNQVDELEHAHDRVAEQQQALFGRVQKLEQVLIDGRDD